MKRLVILPEAVQGLASSFGRGDVSIPLITQQRDRYGSRESLNNHFSGETPIRTEQVYSMDRGMPLDQASQITFPVSHMSPWGGQKVTEQQILDEAKRILAKVGDRAHDMLAQTNSNPQLQSIIENNAVRSFEINSLRLQEVVKKVESLIAMQTQVQSPILSPTSPIQSYTLPMQFSTLPVESPTLPQKMPSNQQ
jgi:hypothetical protein